MIHFYFLFFASSLITGIQSTAVCLKGYIKDDTLQLTCRVSELTYQVVIRDPHNTKLGYCIAPVRTTKTADCTTENTFQNLETNITMLTIYNVNEINISGIWTCSHGSNKGIDSFQIYHNSSRLKTETVVQVNRCSCVKEIIVTLVLTSVFFAITVVVYKRKKLFLKGDKHTPEEARKLLNHEDEDQLMQNLCKTCEHHTAFAFCPDCNHFYCESCYEHHEITFHEHKMIQLMLINRYNNPNKCMKCTEMISTQVCIQCKKLLCNACSCGCINSERKYLILKHTEIDKKREECKIKVEAVMEEEYKVSLKGNYSRQHQDSGSFSDSDDQTVEDTSQNTLPPRVCGLACLTDFRIVVADSNNRKLDVFKYATFVSSLSLVKEPRGVTAMFDDQIAVSFPHQKCIKKYHIDKENHIKVEGKEIILTEVGKPFSIAYNQNMFAVEIGEREDGFIALLSIDGTEVKRIITTYAYFTGNTLRIALDKQSESIYLSAMSKKSLTCIDFSGKNKWSKKFPSPRGVCIVARQSKLLIASRRGNAIYQVNSLDGRRELIGEKGPIESPRYIAYNQECKLLYVHINDKNEDNCIVAFKYEIT